MHPTDIGSHELVIEAWTDRYATWRHEIDVKVARLYDGLSHPVLTDVALDFGKLKVDHLYPQAPAALFRGQEILLTGRYTGGATHQITMNFLDLVAAARRSTQG